MEYIISVYRLLAGTPIRADRISHEFPTLTRKSGMPVIRLYNCRHTAASIMRSHGIPPIIVAGMLGNSLAILMTRYAHLAHFARNTCNIPGTQDEAVRVMNDILTPIPIEISLIQKDL